MEPWPKVDVLPYKIVIVILVALLIIYYNFLKLILLLKMKKKSPQLRSYRQREERVGI